MTTGEFAAACSVEKRTLFYYDEIGLLKPVRVLENGYREYAPEQLARMETIKLLQSAGLSLTEIKSVLLCEREGHNIEVVDECRRRVEAQIAHLKDGLGYLDQRKLLRECYLEHSGEESFIEHFDERPLAVIRPRYHAHMRVSYWNMGHYLCVAEDAETLRPKFFFKFTDPASADTFFPEGTYACRFVERPRGAGIYIPPLVEQFAADMRADGRKTGGTVYVEDLPSWMIDRRDLLILRLSIELPEGSEK